MGRHEELIMMAQMTNNNYSSISFPQENTAFYAYKYSSQSPPTATQTAARLHPAPAQTAPIYRLRFNAICMRIVCGLYAECMRNMFLQGPKNRPIGAPKAQTPHRLLGHLVVPPESWYFALRIMKYWHWCPPWTYFGAALKLIFCSTYNETLAFSLSDSDCCGACRCLRWGTWKDPIKLPRKRISAYTFPSGTFLLYAELLQGVSGQ